GGTLSDKGMPSFAGILAAEDSHAVQAYVVSRARIAYQRQQAGAQP
ncbi:MAG: hypothetical protein HKN81_10740, partial [Gammaproteobacteria bacterium]|nr:hypothetical protein [Gammaproteobacteria bacterium]